MDKLAEIVAWKRREIAGRIRPVRDRELWIIAELNVKRPSFLEAIANPEHLNVIAEIKRKSPSAGDIAATVDASERARHYYNAGADALSVLTDERYFGGSLSDLWDVNDFLQSRQDARPTIRKDFMVHPIQVLEAAEAGAGAILIIVRALNDEEIRGIATAAETAGLDCLYEIHDESELERVLNMDARIVGVNNRDLTSFTTDLAVTERLIPMLPEPIVTVSESGIHTVEDATRARVAGADAVLVGEALMKAEDMDHLVAQFHEA